MTRVCYPVDSEGELPTQMNATTKNVCGSANGSVIRLRAASGASESVIQMNIATSSGILLSAGGMPVDGQRIAIGASGIPMGASGIGLGASGIPMGASGIPMGASGVRMGANGILMGASGIRWTQVGLRPDCRVVDCSRSAGLISWSELSSVHEVVVRIQSRPRLHGQN